MNNQNAEKKISKTGIIAIIICVALFLCSLCCAIYCAFAAQAGTDGTAGKSAYELAVENGYQGTEDEWLSSLIGDKGDTGATGAAGSDGKSAYELAVENGYQGTLTEWLASLVGEAGVAGTDGTDGKSAYELAVENGYQGTLTEWLASLVGEAGAAGADGSDGKSAYELAVENGFEGSLEDWLASLVGEKGDKGDTGAAGRGIEDIKIVNGELIITYTDKTQVNLGSVSESILDRVYTVVFVADGQTVGTVTYTSANTSITEPAVPEKTGYTGRWEDYTLAVGDRTVEAVYTPNEYEVLLSLEGDYGMISGDMTYRYGEEVVITAEPYPSYQFLGWYSGEELVSASTTYSFNMPAKDIEYVARFTVRADMENFDYVAGKDFCVITGVYDTSVTELVVPDCVTDIRTSAFEYCTSLQSLTLPVANKNLGLYFGADNTSLNHSRIPDSLDTIILSESVTEICDSAFASCSKINNIKLPSTIEKIGKDAFLNTSGLNVYISDIAAWCEIYFEDNPLSTGATKGKLFLNDALVKALVIPQGVTQISAGAFQSYGNLESVVIPSTVKSIGAEAFSGCTSLTSVTIEDGVQTIGSRAFWSCTALTSLVIPSSVKIIAAEAFQSCTSLNTIYYASTQEDWNIIDALDKSSAFTKATVYFYSATQPTESGNYWHYDTDGVTPVIW